MSPRERIGAPLSVMGMAYFFKHRFDEAASNLLLAIQDHPGFPPSYRTLAACYAHMGWFDEARAVVARLHVLTLELVPNAAQFRNPEDRELFLSGLRLAAGRGDITPAALYDPRLIRDLRLFSVEHKRLEAVRDKLAEAIRSCRHNAPRRQ